VSKVYLLYLDESGHPSGARGASTYFVLAGLAVHEEDCYPLAKSVAQLQERIVGPANAGLELHASRIWAGRNEWSKVPEALRHRLLDAVFQRLTSWSAPSGRKPRLFAAAIHKPSFRGRSVLELAHEEVFARFDSFISRLHVNGDSHRSLVVADKSSYEALIQKLAPTWKRGGRLGPLHGMVEVPLYVDSKASVLIQLADFVAWATWSYYERRHTRFMQYLNPHFDCDSGIQHGLTHMIRSYGTCGCVPCTSRRTLTVATTIPASF
jgi:hypothetical protein